MVLSLSKIFFQRMHGIFESTVFTKDIFMPLGVGGLSISYSFLVSTATYPFRKTVPSRPYSNGSIPFFQRYSFKECMVSLKSTVFAKDMFIPLGGGGYTHPSNRINKRILFAIHLSHKICYLCNCADHPFGSFQIFYPKDFAREIVIKRKGADSNKLCHCLSLTTLGRILSLTTLGRILSLILFTHLGRKEIIFRNALTSQ